MSAYAERAQAIHGLTTNLRRRMEAATVMSLSDKMAMIDTGVEVVNKLLYCFMIDQALFDSLDRDLNSPYRDLQPNPDSINEVFSSLLGIVRQVEDKTGVWVQKYAN